MKNKIQCLFIVLMIGLFGLSASAVSTIPVPISEENPLRVGIAAKESTSFSPLALRHLGGILGVAYGFGGGFEGGFQLRGGASSDKLFASGSTTIWGLGGDVVLRYLGNVTDMFYLGLQGRVGYDFAFGKATITDASNVTVGVGVPFGLIFGEVVSVYLMPEIDIGGRSKATDGVFGPLVGFGAAVGAYISLGGPTVFVELKPKAVDIADAKNTFALDAIAGVGFEM